MYIKVSSPWNFQLSSPVFLWALTIYECVSESIKVTDLITQLLKSWYASWLFLILIIIYLNWNKEQVQTIILIRLHAK